MKLSALQALVAQDGMQLTRRGEAEVTDLSRDSRKVGAGFVFAALPGERRDGAAFVAMAEERGASAVLLRPDQEGDTRLPVLVAKDPRAAMGDVAHALHGHPTRQMKVIGVTGTNGKTTCTFLIEGVLRALGEKTALLGTVEQRILAETRRTLFTTPESDDLARFAGEARDRGVAYLAMEVSSHGLALSRVRGVHFDVAAFTNLTQDHLDFHPSMEAYAEEKAKLFLEYAPRVSVINVADSFGGELATRVEATGRRCYRISAAVGASDADFGVRTVAFRADGMEATLVTPLGERVLRSPLVGEHNLQNLLTTLAVLHGLSVDLDQALEVIAEGIKTPGRLERVQPEGAPSQKRHAHVYVDYAHTPDALANALSALRPSTEGRLIVVFGCGGDRDREKRPKMGARAAEGADVCVVTSDNPRTEDPEAIVAEILPGVENAGRVVRHLLGDASSDEALGGAFALTDRRAAIAFAIRMAQAGDTVLIAGKGHEDYQIIGEERLPFDDRLIAAEAMGASMTNAERRGGEAS